jgi:hypothetical protein
LWASRCALFIMRRHEGQHSSIGVGRARAREEGDRRADLGRFSRAAERHCRGQFAPAPRMAKFAGRALAEPAFDPLGREQARVDADTADTVLV